MEEQYELVDHFFNEPRIMTYQDLKEANELAIKNDHNRTINLENFTYTVKSFGYDYKTILYPALPIILHEHAQGKKVEPHIRAKIVGPFEEESGRVVQAILDCPLKVFNRFPVYDIENRKLIRMN